MNRLNNIFHLILLIFVVVLGILFFINYLDIQDIKDNTENLSEGNSGRGASQNDTVAGSLEMISNTGMGREEIENLIDQKISAIPTNTPQPTQNLVPATNPTSKPQDMSTTYIPLGIAGNTTETDWTSIDDATAYIDVKTDYGAGAYVQFEANLRVEHGNGTAFVRLWDDTNKIAVVGSEMSVSDSESFKYVLSPKLELWQGRNLYKVQIKSLNSFRVYYSSGKVKVSY